LGRLFHATRRNNVGQREHAFVAAVWPNPCSLLPRLICTADRGSEMDTRDKAVSLVGYLLIVAMVVALIAGVMASF
jgi:hypothetical protein